MVTQWSDQLNLLHASNTYYEQSIRTNGFVRSSRFENEWNFNENESKIKKKIKKKKGEIFENNSFFLERECKYLIIMMNINCIIYTHIPFNLDILYVLLIFYDTKTMSNGNVWFKGTNDRQRFFSRSFSFRRNHFHYIINQGEFITITKNL